MPDRRLNATLLACALVAGLAVTGCATRPTEPEAAAEFDKINDPGEPTNRAVHDFNMAVDRNAFKPVAQAYRDVVPDPMRRSIHNFLTNLDEPMSGFNHLLQGNPGRAWTTLQRFVVNSTLGVAGFFDVATDLDLPYKSADFGQTLGVWGFEEGPYITLPIFGPSNVRDTIGLAMTFAANPLGYIGGTAGTAASLGKGTAQGVDERERNIETLDDLQRNSLDFYATLRSVYRQHRSGQIEDAKSGNPSAKIEYGYPTEDTNGAKK